MLVMSRKKNESIIINDDITIVVVEIRGDKVRLGVEAPKEVPVHRREVFDAIHREYPRTGYAIDPEQVVEAHREACRCPKLAPLPTPTKQRTLDALAMLACVTLDMPTIYAQVEALTHSCQQAGLLPVGPMEDVKS
jgi:carbon storage regulator